jgi:hypothetical protein
MDKMKRYAIYYAPEAGPFATAAAKWLGWDPELGAVVTQPEVGVDLVDLTNDPRKYGFHGSKRPSGWLMAWAVTHCPTP